MVSTRLPHLEFAPPPSPGAGRALVLALIIHGLLLLALTWGVHWQDQSQDMSVEAELWSSIPQPVAAKGQTPEPVQDVVQADPKPTPTPRPQPAQPVTPAKPLVDPQIAIDQQKKKEAQDKAREEAKAKREAKLQEDKEKKAAQAKERERQQAEELKRAEERHLDEVKRLRGLAEATGNATDTGKAVKAAGPSASYLGRLRARIKPNITFSDAQLQTVVGNPAAEVVVICSPSGQIMGVKLKVKSGNDAWDQAVLNAVDKTGSFPRDENGNMPSEITFSMRPRD